ncbi:MAG: DUF1573 domain-containing protein [candidate division Zixibacteria bacterium]|nr:DUF1573 domain-containing protein [candidate division Zixibacteria bacterium]
MKYFKVLILITTICMIPFSSILAQIEKPDDEETEFRKIPLCNARIEFEHTTFDFGSIAKGSSVTHSYWFDNNGSDTLVITKIKPTCGCTSTKTGGIVVPPGERSNIDIIFNSGKFNGKVTKAIKIECNDSVNPYMDIRFKALINNPLLTLEYTPLQADFKTIPVGASKTFTISITNVDSSESRLVLIDKPAKEFIKTKLKKDKIKPGETAEIEFTIAKDLEPGPYLSSVTFEADGKDNSRITIPILASIGEETALKQ